MAEHLHQTPLLSAYLEGELSLIQCQGVEAHLRTCAVCRQELDLLHQTVNILQKLSLLTAPADFVEKLHLRIEEKEKQRQDAQETDAPTKIVDQHLGSETATLTPDAPMSPIVALLRKASPLGYSLRLPLQIKIPFYACAALLGLGLVISHIASEEPMLAPAPPQLQVTPPPAQQVTTVVDAPIQPVDASIPTPAQPLRLDSPLPSVSESFGATQPLQWRMAGSEPTLLHRQVKELAGQIEGATIIREQADQLLISFPTQELRTFRKKLAKLGTASHPENELVPHTSTILLSITFVREPLVTSPPPLTSKRFEGHS